MKVLSKRNKRRAGIEHDPAGPTFTYGVGQGPQAAHVVFAQCGAGLHFHAGQTSGAVFEHKVYFLSGSGAPVEKLWRIIIHWMVDNQPKPGRPGSADPRFWGPRYPGSAGPTWPFKPGFRAYNHKRATSVMAEINIPANRPRWR